MRWVYLVQHGEAKPEHEDPSRPLTERGREEVGLVASIASALNLKIDIIIHSGKLRARQTAEIIAEKLKPNEFSEFSEGLAPLDEPDKIAEFIKNRKDNIMICGHLPNLSKLCSQIILGDKSREVVKFRMGGIVALSHEENTGWRIAWILTPEIAKVFKHKYS